jgi:transcriptional regulator with XRE-family HTH domain
MEKDIIAKNLVELRKSKNLTQKELADELNYSDKVISKWERSESLPDILALEKIASYYNVSIDDLIKNDDNLSNDTEDIKEVVHLEPKKIKEPSKILVWSVVPFTAFLFVTIFIGIEAFLVSSFFYAILLMVYGALISSYTWEAEYQGVKITIQNKPLRTELRIDSVVVDQSNAIFTGGVRLQGKLNEKIVKAYVSSFARMKCNIIIE